MTTAYIPYGAYWSTPFARWQGSLAHLHSLEFAGATARQELQRREIDVAAIDLAVLGTTVPQQGSFYGAPWVAALAGASHVAGPTIAQACATSARCMAVAAHDIANGDARCALVITADRVSNGPQIYYPNPTGPGGSGATESWVLANFERDPWTSLGMTTTAENVALKFGIGMAEQHELVLRRYEQYADAQADDSAFHRRFMQLPVEVPNPAFDTVVRRMTGDEGIFPTNRQSLERLRPVIAGGTVTYGAQTHPADGNAGMLIGSREVAKAFTKRPDVEVQIVSFGQARAGRALMPCAPVPAARAAMASAGLAFDQLSAVKTHNPFVLNDIVLARETGLDVMRMNNFGSSLVWGHPQAPTGLRAVIELIEELEMRGGGYGLFTGCAAGDSAMAVVIKVGTATP